MKKITITTDRFPFDEDEIAQIKNNDEKKTNPNEEAHEVTLVERTLYIIVDQLGSGIYRSKHRLFKRILFSGPATEL